MDFTDSNLRQMWKGEKQQKSLPPLCVARRGDVGRNCLQCDVNKNGTEIESLVLRQFNTLGLQFSVMTGTGESFIHNKQTWIYFSYSAHFAESISY